MRDAPDVDVQSQPSNERRTFVRAPAEILADVATTTSTSGVDDLTTVLDRLGGLAMEATGADRVSWFLLDEGGSDLRLWASSSYYPGDDLWDLGKSMGPISLDEVPERRRLLDELVPIGIEDVNESPVVPREWITAFRLASVVAAPLRAGDQTLGILVVDYRDRRPLPAELVSTVGAIASSAALVVSNAWLTRAASARAADLQALLTATQGLSSSGALSEVADQVADVIADVFHASSLSVQLLRDGSTEYETLVQRGVLLPSVGDLRVLSLRGLARVTRAWEASSPPAPVVLENIRRFVHPTVSLSPEIGSVLVLPLARAQGEVFGFVLVGLERGAKPDASTLELAAALAAHVAFAIERARLAQEVAIGAEFARALLALNELDHDGAEGLLADLHRLVPPTIGFEVVDVRLAESVFPAARPVRRSSPFERELWRRWRQRRTRPEPVEHEGDVYAPIWTDDRAAGVLRARPARGSLAPHELSMLEALASALAEAVRFEGMRRSEHQRERELALAAERAEVASQLHATVGRVLGMIEEAALDLDEDASGGEVRKRSRRLAALARATKDGLVDTERSLVTLAYDPRGLPATLAELVDTLGRRLDAAADVEVRGEPRVLTLEVEQTLTRILFEALQHVQRNGRSSAIAVRLEFDPEGVRLVIRDDGVGLANREEGDVIPGAHFGLRLMQRRLEALGGRLDIEMTGPRGLLLEAMVPA
jgi:signal transduction histidine kinase